MSPVRRSLSAEEFAERLEQAARQGRGILTEILQSVCEHLIAPVDIARGRRHSINWKIDVVSRSRILATGRGQTIGNRTDHRMLQRHGWLQGLGRITLSRL